MKRRMAVRGIFVHEGKLLCVKLKPYNGGAQQDFWCTIGGGVNDGESYQDAIKREVVEETGIEPVVGPLLYMQQYTSDDVESTEFFFEILNAANFANIDLTKSSHGEEEIAEIAFIDTREKVVLPEFLQKIDFSNYLPPQSVEFYSYL